MSESPCQNFSVEETTPNQVVSGKRTLVIGIGNPLMSDDGLGRKVLEKLAQEDLPQGVELIELGTPGWGLAANFEGYQKVVIIDAVRMGQKPGTWRRFSPQQVRFVTRDTTLSLHGPGLAESLELAQALDLLPEELIIYGVEPANTSFGFEISPELEDTIPTLIKNILEDLWKTL